MGYNGLNSKEALNFMNNYIKYQNLISYRIFKILSIVVIVSLLTLLLGNNVIFAENDNNQTELQKLIDYNKRVNDETLEKFAKDRDLIFIPSPSNSENIEILKDNNNKSIPFNEQKNIGEALVKEFLNTNQLILNDPMLLKYVVCVGRLVSNSINNQSNKEYIFGIVNDPSIRLYVFPGGFIFVSRGYLKTLKNEGELAASLAREIAGFDKDLYMKSLTSNEETLATLNSFINELKKSDNNPKIKEDQKKLEEAQKPYSDPFSSIEYYGSPYYDKDAINKSVCTNKLLKKILTAIPNYETIIEKDKIAVYAINKVGYDSKCVKEMILELNKENQQAQVVNRTINIENWANQKEHAKNRNNKVEGRYVMMIERLNF